MRVWILLSFLSACTPSINDERVNANGTSNDISQSATADSQTQTPGAPASADPNTALATLVTATYNDDLQPSVQKLCTASCHRGAPTPGLPLLNAAASLKTAAAAAKAAIDAGRMPQNAAALSVADKKLAAQLSVSLQTWAKGNAYPIDIIEQKPTYVNSISPLATGLCGKCHQGETPAGGLRLTTQDQWKTAMPGILRAIGAGLMPPRVDEVQKPRLIRLLTEWQNQGFR